MPRRNAKNAIDNYIYTYYQGIKDGTYAVGRYIRLVYEKIINGLNEKAFFYDPKKADAAIQWIEGHCYHTKGPLAPLPLKLEVWQKAFLACVFGLVDEEGNRQFREVLLTVARKNGKSKLAECICKYVFQNEGFGTDVFCLAPKLEQASIVYDGVWQMCLLDPEQKELKELQLVRDEHNKRVYDDAGIIRHRQTDLYLPATNSTVKKIAFSAKRSDGFNPSLCICDEIAAWEGDKGLKQYAVMKSGMGTRPNGLLLSCTTSGYINDSIYDELIKRSTRYLMGDSKEKKLLPFLYMIDDPDKWNDLNELRKSNPNIGVSVREDFLLEEIAVAEGSIPGKAEFMTKHACVKQNSSLAWLPSKLVENACGEPLRLEDFEESYCVCGIDLSQTRDLTAVTAVIEKDGVLNVFAHFFLPSAKIEEATQRDNVPYQIYIQRGFLTPSGEHFIDYQDCYKWVTRLIEEYHIYPLMTGYDRYSAQYLIKDLNAYGIHTDDVFQGDNLYGVMQELYGLLEDGKVRIGDNDLLKIHLLDSAVKMSVERGRGRLVKVNAMAHIDGCAALLDAMCVRHKWFTELGDQLKNEG